ncbi:hypothetical protein GYMLUDRAFT_239471 [Collybiopsis luxurians FD-317 M1]|nr:hypothetical protein GYMLUDRAFT_239471 [Collybiopsis luxurians FD-317 M1]
MSLIPECGIPPNIALITGPYVLGGLFSYGLLGILVVQISDRDPTWLKTFVYVLMIFDIAITINWTVFLWQILGPHWGDPTILISGKTAAGIPLLSGMVASMAHCFYAWRIYKLLDSLILPIIVVLISLTTCAMAGYAGIHGAKIGLIRFSEMDAEVSTWLGGSTLCDFLITAVLAFKLFNHGKRTPSSRTHNALLRVITVTVETGFVTALTALFELLMFLIYRNTTLHFIPLFMLSKVYSNCLLATLNARSMIDFEARASKGSFHPLWSDFKGDVLTFGKWNNNHRLFNLPAQVQVATSVHRDHQVELVALQDSKRSSTLGVPVNKQAG